MQNPHPFALVEAFCTPRPGSGNPAGVVLLGDWPSDEAMQRLASTLNQAETAFVGPDPSGKRIRWFTPTVEVRLCGHATLASAAFLASLEPADHFQFQSLSGLLTVGKKNGRLVLDFPAFRPEPADVAEARPAFPHALELWKDRDDWMVVLPDESAVADYEPDFLVLRQMGQRGLAITAPGDTADFAYRFFAPQSGVDEDHATGSAQTYLVPFWAERLGKRTLTSLQLSKRQGMFEPQWEGQRVKIGGTARILAAGQAEI